MKFTIPKATFSAALARIQNICSGRSTMPILSNVLLHAWPRALHISATDLEVGYTSTVEGADIEKPGKITVPAKKLHEIVGSIPTDTVTIETTDNDFINIAGGTAFFNLAGLSAEEFPAMPSVKGETFNLDTSAIMRLLTHTEYCMSKEEMKYNICGIYLKIDAREAEGLCPRLTAVATDGHRLACDSIALPGDPRPIPNDLLRGCIISRKGVTELKKLCTEGILVITIAGNNLSVATDKETLFLRLVDGDFPDYKRIIPTDIIGNVETKRLPLAEALARVSIVTTEKFKGVAWNIAEGGISFKAHNPELGEAADRVTAAVSCEPREVRFNSVYINQALASMACGVVQIHMPKSEMNPIMITPTCEKEPFAVVMPMRL